MRNELITLITLSEKQYDEDGFLIEGTENCVECFAQVKTSTYSEYYSADRVGERVTDIFVVGEADYKFSMLEVSGKRIKPSLVEYDGTRYKIIRRFRRATTADYEIELSCTEVEADG